MSENNYKFQSFIKESEKVSIITHINPDGDTVGSAIAMATIIDNGFEKDVRIFTPNRSPAYLTSIKGFNYVSDFLANTKDAVQYIKESDLIICVDFSDYKVRCGEISIHIEKNKTAKKIVFDHHVAPDLSLYDLAFCDSENSSTANLMLQTMREHNLEDMVNLQVAEALYTGMMTDTGNFSFGNLCPEVYNNIAFLVSKGVKPAAVNSRIFNVKREQAIRLNSYAIYKKMIVDYSKQAAAIFLTKDELLKFDYESGDTEGLVNIPLSIEGIYNSALFIEQEGFIKVSLRSENNKGKDTNVFARKFFNGGGHINASGGRGYNMSLEQCESIYFDNINKI